MLNYEVIAYQIIEVSYETMPWVHITNIIWKGYKKTWIKRILLINYDYKCYGRIKECNGFEPNWKASYYDVMIEKNEIAKQPHKQYSDKCIHPPENLYYATQEVPKKARVNFKISFF